MHTRELSTEQMAQLLDAIAYRMDQDTRRYLMRTLPEAYNRWAGHTCVVVRYADAERGDVMA